MSKAKNAFAGAAFSAAILAIVFAIAGPVGWLLVWAVKTTFGVQLQIGQGALANWLWCYPMWCIALFFSVGMMILVGSSCIDMLASIGGILFSDDDPRAGDSPATTSSSRTVSGTARSQAPSVDHVLKG